MKRDVIVVGASAGGIEASIHLLSKLPPDLAAFVFLVIHSAPEAPRVIDRIIDRLGTLPAVYPTDRERIEPGRIYIAPPNNHMQFDTDRIRLWQGPKESNHRPSINVLFRSAAVTFKQRVAGVVLSGMLDDGAAGLWWIKKYGGVALVQDPATAAFPEMPQSALHYVTPDYVLSPDDLGKKLSALVNSKGGRGGSASDAGKNRAD